ncbi:Dephospho-CoA kinase [hydrothermal vent metagenome]|uniref:Dephospho-CoA kinase n=1 Tax=hydrothermal vent metagenome TaxID=652676 RepID=A0A3B0X6R4_9ZZZZ
MLKIGLTGGIGSGKTSVSDLFEAISVPVIDADIIAHKLVNDDSKILQEIINTFGQDILNINGKLNRKKLAQIIFNVKKNKQQLENILHPKIQQEISNQLDNLTSSKNPPSYVIITVPLLIEVGYSDFVDRILIVISDENKRINRIQNRDGRSLNEIHSIISNQVSDKKRQENADDIIENNGSINLLNSQIQKLHKKYLHLSASIK